MNNLKFQTPGTAAPPGTQQQHRQLVHSYRQVCLDFLLHRFVSQRA